MHVLEISRSNQAKGQGLHDQPNTVQVHNDVDNMVSNFVDSVHIEQCQGELDLLEKERRLSFMENEV